MAEKVIEEIAIVYCSPAFPPEEIDVKKSYCFGKDSKGAYIVSSGEKEYKKVEYIKTFFSPVNKTWDEVL